jgi:hypothetical protein
MGGRLDGADLMVGPCGPDLASRDLRHDLAAVAEVAAVAARRVGRGAAANGAPVTGQLFNGAPVAAAGQVGRGGAGGGGGPSRARGRRWWRRATWGAAVAAGGLGGGGGGITSTQARHPGRAHSAQG